MQEQCTAYIVGYGGYMQEQCTAYIVGYGGYMQEQCTAYIVGYGGYIHTCKLYTLNTGLLPLAKHSTIAMRVGCVCPICSVQSLCEIVGMGVSGQSVYSSVCCN